MKKNLLTYLVPIILVIGTAFGAGLAVAGDCTDETDVVVEVKNVPPEIDILSPEICDGIVPYEDVEIEVKVFSPNHGSAVEDVEIEMKYEGDEDEHGNLDTEAFASLDNGLEIEWEENEPWGTVDDGEEPEGKVTFEPDTMWRFGYWEITATVYGTDGDYYHYDMIWTVAEAYCEVSADDELDTVETTYKPGESAEFQEGTVTVTANYAWELTAEDFEVFDDDPYDGVVKYEGDVDTLTSDPAYEEEFTFTVEDIFIPYGTDPGTYTGTATHTLINIEDPVVCPDPPEYQEETAWAGDTEGGGARWWYYCNTDDDPEQNITAGQHIHVGNVTISEPDDDKVTITLELTGGWELQDGDDTVKLQGYDDIPDEAPAPGDLEHKGTDLVWEVDSYDYYVIHLDVQLPLD